MKCKMKILSVFKILKLWLGDCIVSLECPHSVSEHGTIIVYNNWRSCCSQLATRLCMMSRVQQTLENIDPTDSHSHLIAVHLHLPLPKAPQCIATDSNSNRLAVGVGDVVVVYECLLVKTNCSSLTCSDFHLLFLIEFKFNIIRLDINSDCILAASENSINAIRVDLMKNEDSKNFILNESDKTRSHAIECKNMVNPCSNRKFWKTNSSEGLLYVEQNQLTTDDITTLYKGDVHCQNSSSNYDLDETWFNVDLITDSTNKKPFVVENVSKPTHYHFAAQGCLPCQRNEARVTTSHLNGMVNLIYDFLL